jgi:hypothetical protein
MGWNIQIPAEERLINPPSSTRTIPDAFTSPLPPPAKNFQKKKNSQHVKANVDSFNPLAFGL